MNTTKVTSIFALVCLFLVPLVVALEVPGDECPQLPTPSLIAPCNWTTHQCVRTDLPIVVVSSGVPGTVMAEPFNCVNCGTGCPDVVPPPMTCKGILSITYTETVTASVAAGVSSSMEVGAGGVSVTVSGTLESSIGHSNARSRTFSLECGTDSLPGCEKASYSMVLEILTNVSKKMDHEYKWVITLHHNNNICTIPSHEEDYSYPCDSYENVGTRTSTVTGNAYCGSGTCTLVSTSSDCP